MSATPTTHAAEPPSCRPLSCSSLLPAAESDDASTTDCLYRNRSAWWADYVAASRAWAQRPAKRPIVVALIDDGADTSHAEIRDQLWVNRAEAEGKPGIDDDRNGFVDDVHGWDFVNDRPDVAAEPACAIRAQHGTFMASLIAGEHDNGLLAAGVGAKAAKVMVLRVVGCGATTAPGVDQARMAAALRYAQRMGARIYSLSAHWQVSSPEVERVIREIADAPGRRAGIVVASVPNRGFPDPGYPSSWHFRRLIRAIPIGEDDRISPGTSPVPDGLNLGAPSACIAGAGVGPDGAMLQSGSSNSTAILAGLLAALWASEPYAKLSPDEYIRRVIRDGLLRSPRRSQAGAREPYLSGVPLADACLLRSHTTTSRVCTTTGAVGDEDEQRRVDAGAQQR